MSEIGDKYAFQQAPPLVLSDGTVLQRIFALRDIPLHNVKAGDIGGYIEDEKILKQTDSAWVGGNAKVYGHSRVLKDSLVTGEAELFHSLLTGDVIVSGNAKLTESSLKGKRIRVKDDVVLTAVGFTGENILLEGKAELNNIFGRSTIRHFRVSGNAVLHHKTSMGIEGENIEISENARIIDAASICGNKIFISGEAVLEKGSDIKGDNVILQDYGVVTGSVTLRNNVTVTECANVTASHDDLYPSVSDTVFNGDVEYDISPF